MKIDPTKLLAALSLLSIQSSQAIIIASDTFNYPNASNLVGQSSGFGFSGAWSAGAGSVTVDSSTASGATPGANNSAFRSFSGVNSGSLFASLTISSTASPSATAAVAGFSLHTGGAGGAEEVFLGYRTTQFRLDGASNGNANDRDFGASTANTNIRFLLEMVFDDGGAAETFNAWAFTDDTLPAILPAPEATFSADIGTAAPIDTIRIFDNPNTIGTYDNLLLTTTYADQLIPEPTSSLLLSVAGLICLTRRIRG
ncbi:hypothetical protein V2O64_23880 [Verrucomicrobiaceae bacterium 227]